MKSLIKPIGLYLHIPFCRKKCKYCDFYSSFATKELLENYSAALKKAINQWGGKINRPIGTIYLGGGTPSLISEYLSSILKEIRSSFNVLKDAEITLELNPDGNIEKILENAKMAGVNRLSIGAQSGIDDELKLLGRTHSAGDTKKAVEIARSIGFDNISLDIMLSLPNSNCETLKKSLEFILGLNPEHISAYILKIEKNTAFFMEKESLSLPSDDETADQYLFMCDFLKSKGYNHYEISNFSKENFESRHNLIYWHGEEYLGIGPAAHSFIDKKRFYYEKDLKGFLNGNKPVFDGCGGDLTEYVMLNLRLKDGISKTELQKRLDGILPDSFFKKCELFKSQKLINTEDDKIFLTDNGMLLSNSIISELLECLI